MAAHQHVDSVDYMAMPLLMIVPMIVMRIVVDLVLLLQACKPRNSLLHKLVALAGTFLGCQPDSCPPQAQGIENANMMATSLLSERRSSSKTGHHSDFSHTWDVSLKGRDHNKNRANMQRASSWITVMTFPGCLLLSNYRPYSSLCNGHRSSLFTGLAFLGMLNLTAFLSSLFLMVICGAHFTRLHVTTSLLLISAMLVMNKLM